MAESAPANDDAALVERVRVGDHAAFNVIFHTYRRPLVKFAYRYLQSVAMAEEIVQEVFSEFWRIRETLSVRGALKSYLFGAVKNRSQTASERGRRERTWDDVAREARNDRGVGDVPQSAAEQEERLGPITWNDGEVDVLQAELLAVLRAAIAALPEPQRTVLRLTHQEEMSYADVARVAGMTLNRVRQHIVSANAELDLRLERAGWSGIIRQRGAPPLAPDGHERPPRRRQAGSDDQQREERP